MRNRLKTQTYFIALTVLRTRDPILLIVRYRFWHINIQPWEKFNGNYATRLKNVRGLDAQLHAFLTSALDRSEWQNLRPSRRECACVTTGHEDWVVPTAGWTLSSRDMEWRQSTRSDCNPESTLTHLSPVPAGKGVPSVTNVQCVYSSNTTMFTGRIWRIFYITYNDM